MPRSFVPNRNIERDLRADDDFRRDQRERAERARDESQRIADDWVTGGMIIPRPGVSRGRTMVVEENGDGFAVVNADYGAAIVEWGSRNSPPVAPLRRGLQASGLPLRGVGE